MRIENKDKVLHPEKKTDRDIQPKKQDQQPIRKDQPQPMPVKQPNKDGDGKRQLND